MSNININDRAQKILKILIEHYIREGQPVGSKTLARERSLAMSSASIRNIMADLETAGFLNSPHTSAGRIPTNRGYRFFVDSLLNTKVLGEQNAENFATALTNCNTTQELVSAASTLLSSLTKLTGLVMLPRRDALVLRHAEFLPLSNNRILVILVLNNGEVQNRIIHTNRIFSANELLHIGNYLTQNFVGKELPEIRQKLLEALQNERRNIETLTQNLVDIAAQALETEMPNDYVVSGEANLIDNADRSGITKLRELFNAFAEKRDILHLLDQCIHTDGIKIFIGDESGYDPLGDCSMITTPYHAKGKVVGVLGVIGPMRIPYEHVIAAVDVTAKLMSAALEELG